VLELTAGDARALVDPEAGGRLRSLAVGDFELLSGPCFVMAPWAGRTGFGTFTFEGVEHHRPVVERHAPHAIHGTVRDRSWVVEAANPRQVRISVGLGPDWPWEGWCEQVVSLDPDGIRLELSVHTASAPFPAIVGWHPWFADPDHTSVIAAALLQRGEDHLPTGVRLRPPVPERFGPLDDCFEDIRWPARLRWDDAALELTMTATGCDHVVVFNEIEGSTCVEPQTGPPDGLRSGEARVVRVGEPLLATTTWTWGPPSPRDADEDE
jgi:aldose 1-epimerase